MHPGIGGVVRIVEEAEIHAIEELVGRGTEFGSGVADHHERGGEPPVVDGGEERTDRPGAGRSFAAREWSRPDRARRERPHVMNDECYEWSLPRAHPMKQSTPQHGIA